MIRLLMSLGRDYVRLRGDPDAQLHSTTIHDHSRLCRAVVRLVQFYALCSLDSDDWSSNPRLQFKKQAVKKAILRSFGMKTISLLLLLVCLSSIAESGE